MSTTSYIYELVSLKRDGSHVTKLRARQARLKKELATLA
jgi:hypothetical protein